MGHFSFEQVLHHSMNFLDHLNFEYYLIILIHQPNLVVKFDHQQHHFQVPIQQPFRIFLDQLLHLL